MHETLTGLLSWFAGLGLGAIFFAGLWWTVLNLASSRRPALLFMGSLLLRMGLSLAGFYWVSNGHWQRLLLCLLGFVTARLIVMRLTRSTRGCPHGTAQEAHNAP